MIKTLVDRSAVFGQVRTQGLRSTCLACAVSDIHAVERTSAPLSAEYLLYYAAQKQLPTPHNDGLFLSAVASALTDKGQCEERHYPYDAAHANDSPLRVPPDPFPHLTHKAFVQVTKTALGKMLGGGLHPLLISNITRRFQFANAANDVVEFDASDPRVGVHAMVAVGWGSSNSGREYFKIRNSWSEKWGNNGHAWLAADYIAKHLTQAAALKI